MHIDFSGASAVIDRSWRDLRTATAFLTCLPVQPPPQPANDDTMTGLPAVDQGGYLAPATGAFPVIGLTIGAIAALIYVLTVLIGLPPIACALFALAVPAGLTAALHEDGLADFCDGLVGGRSAEQRLSIMRDSRIGTAGALAIVYSIVLRVVLLAHIPSLLMAVAALIVAGAASRAALPGVMRWIPPARDDGLAREAGRPQPTQVTIALAVPVVAAFLFLPLGAAVASVGCAAVGAFGIAMLARRAVGGHTGDVLGAVQQTVEVLVLAAVAAAA
jgi:adenosylcobinamide-GDP ribazoletransferase